MKLLSKSEVVRAKSIERQQQIDEGLKLAKKVDSLREIVANEEEALNKFRTQTLEEIHQQITSKSKELEYLVSEVNDLEKRQKEALRPLNKEREEIQALRESVEESFRELREREVTLTQQERDVEKKQKDVLSKEKRANLLVADAQSRLVDADILKKEASEAKKQGIAIRTSAEQFLEKAEKEISAKQIEVAHRVEV